MTFEETRTILKIIKAEWPQSFSGMTKEDALARLNLWAEMFADDDAALVAAAVKALIVAGSREFAPNIGIIKEQMRKLIHPEDMSEADAWARIRKAIANGNYGSVEEFSMLPPVLQRVVGSPNQLKEWARIDSDELNTVVASNVQRAFRTVSRREQEREKLPKDVLQLVAGLTEQRRISAGSSVKCIG